MLDLTINDYPISYIIWNILLGIIPFFLGYAIFRLQKIKDKFKQIYQLIIFFIWLAFLPNVSYILTDMRHINGFCPNTITDICVNNAWMIAFFFLYGLVGWILYFYAMEQMIVFIKRNISKKLSYYFPIIIAPIISLGLLLGLVDRLNTWDVIFRLNLVFSSALTYITVFDNFVNLLVYTFALLIIYYVGKIVFKKIEEIKILRRFIR